VGPGADGYSFFCETVIYFIGDVLTAIVAGDFAWSGISSVLCIVSFIPIAMHDHFANATLTMTQLPPYRYPPPPPVVHQVVLLFNRIHTLHLRHIHTLHLNLFTP
jgi:hypothetical protein